MPRFDKLLVLDLDETLLHAADSEDDVGRSPDHRLFDYPLYRRPHVDTFLAWAREHFELGVWTSSSASYAAPVVDWLGLGDVSFVWSRQRCSRRFDSETMDVVYRKPLWKLLRRGYAKEKVLFVDDTPEKIAASYGNHVPVRPYEGDLADDELLWLPKLLESLGPLPNVRAIEKRGWRRRFVDG
ncbi:MAG: HAD family hydrolase [Sandaracinus sp.]|nr:HAD family hydrolase [Myxococcales bacterium]MCB9611774.1 HAD family hydrolase [Sandaracinus sp.]